MKNFNKLNYILVVNRVTILHKKSFTIIPSKLPTCNLDEIIIILLASSQQAVNYKQYKNDKIPYN